LLFSFQLCPLMARPPRSAVQVVSHSLRNPLSPAFPFDFQGHSIHRAFTAPSRQSPLLKAATATIAPTAALIHGYACR
jgi:hypothetical protein